MDPPSDAFSPNASPIVRYAQQVAEPLFEGYPSILHSDQPFCETCQKNQHMYQSFISNYESDHADQDDARSLSPDRKFLAYKKDMQQRYPQVCADCKQGVEDRIRIANRMAQADALRQRLDKTKTKHNTSKTPSWLEFFSLWGGVIYWAATSAQALACLLGLIQGISPRISQICAPEQALAIQSKTDTLILSYLASVAISACAVRGMLSILGNIAGRLPSLGQLTIFLTLASSWWNPYFRNMIRGYDRHIHGFLDWYKYQAILSVTRIVFWTMMSKGQFSQKDAPSTMGAQCFMLGFTLLIARISGQSIQVDFRKLFSNVRERQVEDSPIASNAQTSVYRGNSLLDALNDATNDRNSTRSSFQTISKLSLHPSQNTSSMLQSRRLSSSPISTSQQKLSLAEMSEQEVVDHIFRGDVPTHLQHERDDGAMDWMPSERSRYTEFEPQIRRPIHSSLPVISKDPTPFWYKVPPAPKNQTKRAFDPFKKSLFEAVSVEKKQNFFNTMTGRSPMLGKSLTEEKRVIDMAPPKFFAPKEFESTGLEDLMEKAFTIKGGDTPGKPLSKGMFERASTPPSPTLACSSSLLQDESPSATARGQSKGWKTHLVYALGLSLAFALWHDTFNNTRSDMKRTALGIMVLTAARAIRILTDHTVTDLRESNASLRTTIATTVGGLEAAFATYLVLEISTMQRLEPTIQSKGSGLIGGMLIQELWFLFFYASGTWTL